MPWKVSIAKRRQEIRQAEHRDPPSSHRGTPPPPLTLVGRGTKRQNEIGRNSVIPLAIALPAAQAELLEAMAPTIPGEASLIEASIRREPSLLILNIQPAEAKQALLPVDKVAEILSLSRSRVYRLVKQHRLPAYRIGRTLRFDPQDVLSFLAGCLESPGGKPCI